MTNEQLATYAQHIANNPDPEVMAALAAGDNNAITEWYNRDAAPDFWVLRDNLPADVVIGAMDWKGEYAAFSDDINAISLLINSGQQLGFDPRLPNAREGLNTVFTAAPNSKAQILDIAARLASEVEKVFAEPTTGVGGGDGSAKAQSAIATYLGPVSVAETRAAVALLP